MSAQRIELDSPLIASTRQAARLPAPWAAVLLSAAFILGAQVIGSIPAVILLAALVPLIHSTSPISAAIQQDVLLVCGFAPIFLVVWAWMRLYEKRPLQSAGLQGERKAVGFLGGFGAALVMFSLVIACLSLAGAVQPRVSSGSADVGWAAAGGIMLALLGWVVQSSAEELLTRGWLMPVIAARSRPFTGLAVSALVFAAYHSLNPHLNPISIVNLVLFGLFMGWTVLRLGSLWPAFGYHTAWNWAQGNVFGLQVSGLNPAGGSLFGLVSTGPEWLTGGSFGPEGGLAVTALMLGGLLLLWLMRPRRVIIEPV